MTVILNSRLQTSVHYQKKMPTVKHIKGFQDVIIIIYHLNSAPLFTQLCEKEPGNI